MSNAFPTPYAGSYYPIYNSGTNQYIPPTASMPFNKISSLFVAFAHAYQIGSTSGAQLLLETDQPDEPARLSNLVQVARAANPGIKILISLGWGKDDWTYISNDYTSGQNQFASSVVKLVQQYGLDGFDIDDESIGGSSGNITQENFNAVVQNIRTALNAAGTADKPLYFTITPAFGTAQVTEDNMACFDLVNCQCYGGTVPSEIIGLGYPANQVAWGIDSEGGTASMPTPQQYQGLAGIFNWTMSADSNYDFKYTNQIATAVGYNVG